MNKTIRLTLLAVTAAAALVLTSCDRMLESLFPSETGQGPKQGSNSLTFTIQGHDYWYQGTYIDYYGQLYIFPISGYGGFWGDDYYGYYPSTNALRTIYVKLYDAGGTLVDTQTTTFSAPDAYGLRSASAYFSGLNDGSYTFQVWYDLDNDGYANVESGSYNGYYYQSTGYIGTSYLTGVHLPYQSSTSATIITDLSEYPLYQYYGP